MRKPGNAPFSGIPIALHWPEGDAQPRRAPVAEPPPLPRQRRRRMVVLGVLLIAVGAAVTGYVFVGTVHQHSVVVMDRDVPVGATITAPDLGTVMVAAGPGVATIPGDELRDVLGRVAAVDLRHGTLLAAAEVTNALTPRPGQELVPISLKVAQLPARGLSPGEQVLIVATPASAGDQNAAPAGGNGQLNSPAAAVVDDVSPADPDGLVRIDLVVDASQGPAIAQQASTGRVGLIVTARRP